jgi:shikimate dehydrogenase
MPLCGAHPQLSVTLPLPAAAGLLSPSMFVGDVIAGHGITPFLQAAQAKGCRTANGDQMVEAVREVKVAFLLGNRSAIAGAGT